MKADNKVLAFLVGAGMDFCFLYAGANFATSLIFQRTWPFTEALVSFLAAALLTLFTQGRGWRVIFIVAIEAIGFVPLLLRMADAFRSWNDAFLMQTWFTKTFDNPADAVDYFLVLLLIMWALVFWAGGASFASRSRDYASLSSRFDRGLSVFFVVLLFKFYFEKVQGIPVNDAVSGLLIIPFLIFSLLALGLERTRGGNHKEFIPGYRRLGVLIGFITISLLGGTAAVFFFMPLLTMAAETGNTLLSLISTPLVSLLFMITTLLFGSGWDVQGAKPEEKQPTPETANQWNIPGWLEFIGRILVFVFATAVVLVILAILAGIVYAIVMWLFSKTCVDENKPSPRQLFSSFMRRLCSILTAFGQALLRGTHGYHGAEGLYLALCVWGGQSGLVHSPVETPNEYAVRLKQHFPALGHEVDLIVEAFNRQVYGEVLLDRERLAAAHSASRTMASPTYWPMRIKTWFVQPTRGVVEHLY